MKIIPVKKETSYFFKFSVDEDIYYVVADIHVIDIASNDVTFLVKKHNIDTENLYGQAFKNLPKDEISFYLAEMVLRAYFSTEQVRKLYEQKYKECNEKQRQIDELMEKLEGAKNED